MAGLPFLMLLKASKRPTAGKGACSGMSMWLLKCPLPITASLQIAIAWLLVLERSNRHGQVGRPRVLTTAGRLISTVPRLSDAGRWLPIGSTVPATCSAIGADFARGSLSGLIQP